LKTADLTKSSFKIHIPLLLCSLPILPVAFDAIRQGFLFFVCLVIVAMACIGTLIASRVGNVKTLLACWYFSMGIYVMEIYFFLSWYFQHAVNWNQAKQGLIIALIEGGGITVIGALVISLTVFFMYRFRKF
jgi:hypothetical protein